MKIKMLVSAGIFNLKIIIKLKLSMYQHLPVLSTVALVNLTVLRLCKSKYYSSVL